MLLDVMATSKVDKQVRATSKVDKQVRATSLTRPQRQGDLKLYLSCEGIPTMCPYQGIPGVSYALLIPKQFSL